MNNASTAACCWRAMARRSPCWRVDHQGVGMWNRAEKVGECAGCFRQACCQLCDQERHSRTKWRFKVAPKSVSKTIKWKSSNHQSPLLTRFLLQQAHMHACTRFCATGTVSALMGCPMCSSAAYQGSYFGRLERAHERNDLQVSAHQPHLRGQ